MISSLIREIGISDSRAPTLSIIGSAPIGHGADDAGIVPSRRQDECSSVRRVTQATLKTPTPSWGSTTAAGRSAFDNFFRDLEHPDRAGTEKWRHADWTDRVQLSVRISCVHIAKIALPRLSRGYWASFAGAARGLAARGRSAPPSCLDLSRPKTSARPHLACARVPPHYSRAKFS